MKRLIPMFASLVFAALGGCDANCPQFSTIDGVTYRSFANLTKHKTVNEDAFPSYETPGNGKLDLAIYWGSSETGPITVVIDDQQFEGTGKWDAVECGNFQIDFAGRYESPIGSIHAIAADGPVMFYADRIEGLLRWRESWTADGESGTLRGDVQLRGRAKGG